MQFKCFKLVCSWGRLKIPAHMLIQDHTLIFFYSTVHPTWLFGTTRLLGPLEYFFMTNFCGLYSSAASDREGPLMARLRKSLTMSSFCAKWSILFSKTTNFLPMHAPILIPVKMVRNILSRPYRMLRLGLSK